MEKDYEPWGLDWEKSMTKLTKKQIIVLFREVGQKWHHCVVEISDLRKEVESIRLQKNDIDGYNDKT